MPGRIPPEFIRDVVARADIVDVIQARITLKKKGKEYAARCPFHDEKSPSFTVSQPKQFYHCFGCGEHGNVISFLMAYDRLDFVDAIEVLAAQQGVDVPYETTHQKGEHKPSTDLYPILDYATGFYSNALKQSSEAIAYLKSRGLTGETAKTFRLGFAPAGWENLTKSCNNQPQAEKTLAENGLTLKGDRGCYDRFRNRIMFPIRDLRGRVIAFGGRALDDDPAKYMNSPETPIFHKGEQLYGLYEARQANRQLDRLLVVEGYMDVVSLAQHGITYAVATLGTATTARHAQLLFRYTPEIIYCFDGDNAGRKAAWKALLTTLPLMHDGVQAKFLFLPEKEDPDSYIQANGQAIFEALLAEAESIADFFFKQLQTDVPLESLDAKARFAKEASQHLKTIPEGIFKKLMLKRLSSIVEMDVEAPSDTPLAPPSFNIEEEPVQNDTLTAPMKLAIALLLQHPEIIADITLPEPFTHCRQLGAKLLSKIYDSFTSNPKQNVGSFLALCEHPQEQRCVADLASWALNIEENHATEFTHALERILNIERKAELNRLIRKAKSTPLTDDEKHRMQALLTPT